MNHSIICIGRQFSDRDCAERTTSPEFPCIFGGDGDNAVSAKNAEGNAL